jgi:hypothetical protein
MFRQKLLDLLALLEFYLCDLINPLKSSLGRNPKLKESIEDPFRQKVWLGSDHV